MRISVRLTTTLGILVLADTGCAGPSDSAASSAPTVTVTATPEAAGASEPDETPGTNHYTDRHGEVTATPEPQAHQGDYRFPEGYPEVVAVGDLPQQIQSAFQEHSEAVTLTPGLWTALPVGATLESTVEVGGHAGWCASIEAFGSVYITCRRRKYCLAGRFIGSIEPSNVKRNRPISI